MTTKKNDATTNLVTCANGLTANYPTTRSWVLGTKTYQRGDILNLLQMAIAASLKTKTDHATWLSSSEAEQLVLLALHPVLALLKKALESEWGATSTKMAEYGFAPAKPPVKTAASKAASAAKSRATRAAKKAALAKAVAPAAAPEPAAAPAPTGPVSPKTA